MNDGNAPAAQKPAVLGIKETMAATNTIVTALEPFTLDQRRTILGAVANLAGVRTQGSGAPRQQAPQGQRSGR
jgi:hypothetical protein